MGMVQALVSPGTSIAAFISSASFSGVIPGPPLALGLQHDGGLDHGQRRRIGGGIGATDLPEHVLHLRKGPDDPVRLLQKFARLGDRDARQRGRHVEEVAFPQGGHEFGADPGQGDCRHCQGECGESEDGELEPEDRVQ